MATWKGSLLTMVGRVQLVKSVIQSMMVYTMLIFSWPKQILHKIQMWISNFIWMRDSQKRGLIMLNWMDAYKPKEEKVLGLRSLHEINMAGMVKLAWNFLNGKNQWCEIVSARYNRTGRPIQHHKSSSVWPRIKEGLKLLEPDIAYIVGADSNCYGTMHGLKGTTWLKKSQCRTILYTQQTLR